jgi:hypothetical protein
VRWIDPRPRARSGGDHCEDNGTGKAGQVAKPAGAEGEAGIVDVAACTAVGERRKQHGSGMVLMCRPSAIRAMEPKSAPPPISSSIIMVPQTPITAQARRLAYSLALAGEDMAVAAGGVGVRHGFSCDCLREIASVLCAAQCLREAG